MEIPLENTLWSMMAGGLLVMVLLTAADALVTRGAGAARNVILIAALGVPCVLMSGLPQMLLDNPPERLLAKLDIAAGPLGCGIGLRYLGLWVGGSREDRPIYLLSVITSLGMLLFTLVLAILGGMESIYDFSRLQVASAWSLGVAVVITTLIAIRAMTRGDPLARWLVLACPVLGVAAVVLNLRVLHYPMSLPVQALGAFAVVLFVFICTMLVIARHRVNEDLARLSRLDTSSDPVTGLSTGGKLISDLEHAFWRAGRLHGRCFVVCVYLNNLYELGDSMGRTTDNQILAMMSARIRRASGFRCVVGVYHPRCFVIVFSQDHKRRAEQGVLERMRQLVSMPLQIHTSAHQRLQFRPQVGISSITVAPDRVQPLEVLNELEHRAMEEVRRSMPDSTLGELTEDQIDTGW
ncbi:unnamed protein product [Victoria cruziana]